MQVKTRKIYKTRSLAPNVLVTKEISRVLPEVPLILGHFLSRIHSSSRKCFHQGHLTGRVPLMTSGAPYPVQKHQRHLIQAAFWLQGHLTGKKSSGALWILLNLQNPGNDRETEDIGCDYTRTRRVLRSSGPKCHKDTSLINSHTMLERGKNIPFYSLRSEIQNTTLPSKLCF